MSISINSISSTSYDITSGEYLSYLINATDNDVDINLPEIMSDGEHYYFRNISGLLVLNSVTIFAHSGNTIENNSNYILTNGSYIHIVAYGTKWYIIS